VIMLLGLVGFYMNATIIGGQIYMLSAQQIDLRGRGLSGIGGLKRMTGLDEALLSGNRFEDVSELSALENCRYMDLTGNPVSEESYRMLREALPGCFILCEAGDESIEHMALGGYTLPGIDALERVFMSHRALKTVDLRGTTLTAEDAAYLSARFGHITFLFSGQQTKDTHMIAAEGMFEAAQAIAMLGGNGHFTVTGYAFTPDEYRAMSVQFPEAELDCLLVICGRELLPGTVVHMDLTGETADDALMAEMKLLPNLRSLTFAQMLPSEAERWKRELGLEQIEYMFAGQLITPQTTSLDMRGVDGVQADELEVLLNALPGLTEIRMDTPDEQMLALIEANGERVKFVYDVEAFGMTFSSVSERIDLGGAVTDRNVDELIGLIGKLEHLKEVIMYDSTLSQANMDRLFDGYPDIFFGWTLNLCNGKYIIRTDITAFSTRMGTPRYTFTHKDFVQLRYCKRLLAIDLGHNAIRNLEFLTNFPQLRILILADNDIRDISPLASLTQLEYLELFMNYNLRDFSPLENLPLKHLNVCYCGSSEKKIRADSFIKIKTLERFWASRAFMSSDDAERIRRALPDCQISIAAGGSTDHGWRDGEGSAIFEVIDRMFKSGVYEPLPK